MRLPGVGWRCVSCYVGRRTWMTGWCTTGRWCRSCARSARCSMRGSCTCRIRWPRTVSLVGDSPAVDSLAVVSVVFFVLLVVAICGGVVVRWCWVVDVACCWVLPVSVASRSLARPCSFVVLLIYSIASKRRRMCLVGSERVYLCRCCW